MTTTLINPNVKTNRKREKGHLSFEMALSQALHQRLKAMTHCQQSTRDKLVYRVNRFVEDGYDPILGWYRSLTNYINRLEGEGVSDSYIRGVRSSVASVGAYLPMYQSSLFDGDTE